MNRWAANDENYLREQARYEDECPECGEESIGYQSGRGCPTCLSDEAEERLALLQEHRGLVSAALDSYVQA